MGELVGFPKKRPGIRMSRWATSGEIAEDLMSMLTVVRSYRSALRNLIRDRNKEIHRLNHIIDHQGTLIDMLKSQLEITNVELEEVSRLVEKQNDDYCNKRYLGNEQE